MANLSLYPVFPLAVGLLAALLMACGDLTVERTPKAVPTTPEQLGRLLYERHGCALCHGPQGGGDGPLAATLDPPPRDLRDPSAYSFGPGEREIIIVLEEGIADFGDIIMPSYRHLGSEEHSELASYIVSIQSTDKREGDEEP